MEELIKRLERVIATGVPDKDGMHPISAETVLEVVKEQLGTNLASLGTDCISRQAALVAVKDALMAWSYMPERRDEKILESIAELPSVEPKRGRWHYSDGKPARIGLSFGVICDQCGTESEYCTNFCGECGAKMEVTE